MNSILQDLRFAFRALRKSPGFATVAVLTLALGIGATTAMFSVVNGVLLRPLPYPKADRIVQLAEVNGTYRGALGVTYDAFRFVDANATGFQSLAATTSVGFDLFARDHADRVRGLRVSRDYFKVLGVSPALGRTFTAVEDQPGGPPVAMLSHGLWARRFGSDPTVLGQTVLLDGNPYTVVGVMPAGVQAMPAVDIWSTLAQVGRTIGSGQNLEVIGRLAPGVSLAQARARVASLSQALRDRKVGFNRKSSLDLLPLRDVVVGDVRGKVNILFGAIAFVLLIACANVANLVLGRTAGRAREVAVRVALGAPRWRVVRFLLTESVVLALAGGMVGLLFAEWGLRSLLAIAPPSLPRTGDVHLDGWALGFAILVSVVAGVAFGVLPAWRATRPDVHETLKEGVGRSTDPGRRTRARGVLVAAEVALSLVLLVGAGLLIATFANLTRVDPGFRTDHLLTAEMWISGSRYDSTAAISGFYGNLIDRVDAVPGVRDAAVVEAGLPLERGGNLGVQFNADPQWYGTDYRTVTPGYFRVLGVPLLRGRALTDADRADAEPVAVVNEALARRFLPDTVAIGQTIRPGGDVPRRIVGVVGDVRSHLDRAESPTFFVPSAQTSPGRTKGFASWFPIHLVVRTSIAPGALSGAIAGAIHASDPLVPVGRIRTMGEVLQDSLAFQHFTMLLLGVFAALALGLAAVGIYAVMSYLMVQRTHEIGVRIALGAQPGEVVRLMVSRGMIQVAIGVGIGIVGALALTRLLVSQLYGVAPRNFTTFLGATLVLAVAALIANWWPAHKATRVDPLEALRSE